MKLNLSLEWYKHAGLSEEGFSVVAGVQALSPRLTCQEDHSS
jgi:hypothetical protein